MSMPNEREHSPGVRRAALFRGRHNVREACIEAVSVCVPHPLHAANAVLAAECGAHVLIEKPLASNFADCDAILDAAARAGTRVSVVSQRRCFSRCKG